MLATYLFAVDLLLQSAVQIVFFITEVLLQIQSKVLN